MNTKTVSSIEKKIEAATNRLEIADQYGHRDTNGAMFYVSAKMSGMYFDPADIIAKVSTSPAIREYLTETCTDDWVNKQCGWYIEHEADYAREYMDGVAFNKDEPEYARLMLIKNSEYHRKNNDKPQRSCGFYGRSGGQFCFGSVSYAENLIEEAESAIKYAVKGEEKHADLVARDYLASFYEYMDAIDWITGDLEKMRKGIEQGWPEELQQRIEEEKDAFLDDSTERREYLNK